MFIYDSNPLFDSPGANRWREAIAKIPFVVSFSSFLDESATYADLLLPDHTFLERIMDVTPPAGIGRAMVGIGAAVAPPLYNTRHTGDVLLEVAQALGKHMTDALPWPNFEELLKFRFKGIFKAGEGSIQAESFDEFWAELLKRGVWEGPSYPYGQWDDVLTTASGTFEFKMELLAQILETISNGDVAGLLSDMWFDAGVDTVFFPHHETPIIAGRAADYPLLLIPYQVLPDAANRAPNAPQLWDIYGLHLKEGWGNWAELNPETAHSFGIHDGDMIWVESSEGKIQLKARLYDGTMPDAINIPLGGGHTTGGRWASAVRGANPAEIVVPQSDPLTGSAAWLGTRVKVYK